MYEALQVYDIAHLEHVYSLVLEGLGGAAIKHITSGNTGESLAGIGLFFGLLLGSEIIEDMFTETVNRE